MKQPDLKVPPSTDNQILQIASLNQSLDGEVHIKFESLMIGFNVSSSCWDLRHLTNSIIQNFSITEASKSPWRVTSSCPGSAPPSVTQELLRHSSLHTILTWYSHAQAARLHPSPKFATAQPCLSVYRKLREFWIHNYTMCWLPRKLIRQSSHESDEASSKMIYCQIKLTWNLDIESKTASAYGFHPCQAIIESSVQRSCWTVNKRD